MPVVGEQDAVRDRSRNYPHDLSIAIRQALIGVFHLSAVTEGTAATLTLYPSGRSIHFSCNVLKDALVCVRRGALREVKAIAGTVAEVSRASHH